MEASVDSYRAGYTPKERRQIETALFTGKLLALSATNAMELGVDVGLLDAVVMNGYPGSVSSFWQQAGRAGRGSRDGIAIMVAHDDPLEQFLVRDPNLILVGGNESVALNPENPQILTRHLICTAYEKPIGMSELAQFGESALELAEGLDRKGELQFQSGRFYCPQFQSPRAMSTSEEEVRILSFFRWMESSSVIWSFGERCSRPTRERFISTEAQPMSSRIST